MRFRLNRWWGASALGLLGLPALLLTGCAGSRDSALLAQAADVAVLPPRGDQAEMISRAQKTDPGPVQGTIFESVGTPFPPLKQDQGAIRIRAQVNGVPVLDDEVREASILKLRSARTDADRVAAFNSTLDDLIDTELVMQDLNAHLAKIRPTFMQRLKAAAHEQVDKQIDTIKDNAKKAGVVIKNDEDFKKFMLGQGLSVEEFRRRNERKFMADQYMRSRLDGPIEHDVSHEDIVEYYQQHPNQFKVVDRIDWQDIFINVAKYRSRQEAYDFAVQLAQRAANGEDFVHMATLYGSDSIYRDGAGFGHLRGEIRPREAESVLFQLKPGQVGPIIELPHGYHVVRLVKRDYAGMRPLDDKAQNEIRHKLENEVFEREAKRLIANLRARAIIEKAPYHP